MSHINYFRTDDDIFHQLLLGEIFVFGRQFKLVIPVIVVPVVILLVGARIFSMYIDSKNHISTDDARISSVTTIVSSKISGRIKKLYFEGAESVKAGDILVKLEDTEQKIDIEQGKIGVNAAEAHLSQLTNDMTRLINDINADIEQARPDIDVASSKLVQAEESARMQEDVYSNQIKQCQATLAAARQELSKAQAGPREQEKEAAVQAERVGEANLENARNKYNRLNKLFSQGMVSAQDRDNAKTELEIADAQYKAAQEQSKIIQAGTRQEDIKIAMEKVSAAEAALNLAISQKSEISIKKLDIITSKAEVAHSQAVLKKAVSSRKEIEVKQSEIKNAKALVAQSYAQLRKAYADLTNTVIRAPSDGIIIQKHVNEGEIVSEGQPIYSLSQSGEIQLTANIEETKISKVRKSQNVEIKVDAWPGRIFHGKVSEIKGATGSQFSLIQPDNAPGSYTKVVQRIPIIVDIYDPKVQLIPGMSAFITIDIRNEGNK